MADRHNILGVAEGVRPFLFDFDDYERMDHAGVFADQHGRVELIEGVIVHMAPQGFDHTTVTSDVLGQFYVALKATPGEQFRVLTQGTLKIGNHSAPEPDVFVVRRTERKKYYEAADAVLVVEVSISTADADKTVKVPLYARAGIPELWIVEPEQASVTQYRGPRPDGTWDDVITVIEGAVSPLFAPEIAIVLADLFHAA
ncbi:Uma2 family endonuclease [Brevundimonas sp.]|uniref:Uma2 family endonuclease n=1 Tax=Brevundimonas sp. TaxID=1871086 RepID=UPI001A2D4A65|nr:Uma2 family endonuclease [Brevundimonas sp.]MBJ7484168.1 Uma2 family endonuclease [Brevundimonas sp.]